MTHILTINNSEIIKKMEARTFKFGKAREEAAGDKLTNNVKMTDMPYERDMLYDWIDNAVANIRSSFDKYAQNVQVSYASGHNGDKEYKISTIPFILSEKWDSANGDGFDSDCKESIINSVISDFLELSLPKESELYALKAMQALKNAERKLYFKKA